MTIQANKLIYIQTITPVYDSVEDRIRLCVNYKDINKRVDFMLTRGFLLKLLPTIEEYIYKYYSHEFIEQKNKNTVDKIEENKNLSQTDMQDFELYKNREDLLYTINLSYNETTQLTTLHLVSKSDITASVVCNVVLLKSILESIIKSIPKVGWGIGYL